ncbi:MAG: glycosyltransferase family 2 protein [Thermodesulfobacteriota bacterium]|nr:glycosyltransferase family 2 protein [Thermodesulfobacteriota bacterium]
MIEAVFWLSISVLAYTFIGYPIILKCVALLRKPAVNTAENFVPSVSILLSVYNEENVIKEKIRNFLSLDYPRELLEMVIVSDKCTDKTEEIIRSFNCDRIRLLVQEKRSGKTTALNRAVVEAKGDVLIFTDANSMFDKDAVRKLAKHFANPVIGLVSGRSVYLNSLNQNEELGGAYRKYEEMIKEDESRVASIVGADGAIYALRKGLYDPLKPEYINDLIHPIQVVLKGYRAISGPRAVCREVVDETHSGELRRQTRIMAQSWLIFCTQIGRLLRKMKLVYAWELASHKFLRWLTIPVMIALFVTTAFMFEEGKFYQMMFISQLIFLSLALFGGRLKSGFMRMPYMFTLLHVASVFGFFKYMTGSIYTTWNPRNN